MSTEEWRPVVGYEGHYEVSDQGRVRVAKRRYFGKIMSTTSVGDPYPALQLWRDSKPRVLRVHRLVLEAFVGPRPDGLLARHLDGDPTNNALTNLRWGTYSENGLDSVRHGTHPSAAKTHCPQGHAYDEVNTYQYGSNRQCRPCSIKRATEWNRKHRKTRAA